MTDIAKLEDEIVAAVSAAADTAAVISPSSLAMSVMARLAPAKRFGCCGQRNDRLRTRPHVELRALMDAEQSDGLGLA